MSDRGSEYYPRKSDYYPKEYVTITVERKVAEDLYYALLLALGGSQYDTYGKNGKNGKDGKNGTYGSYETY